MNINRSLTRLYETRCAFKLEGLALQAQSNPVIDAVCSWLVCKQEVPAANLLYRFLGNVIHPVCILHMPPHAGTINI